MKVKRKNLKIFFIGKILRFGCIYLALFNIFKGYKTALTNFFSFIPHYLNDEFVKLTENRTEDLSIFVD